ncbi:MAG: RNA polymerase sigma factor [Tetrasphaera sp.]
MPDGLDELAAAVAADDPVRSRDLVRDACPEGADDVLRLLATDAASGSALATELLIEQLDGSGIVRRLVRSSLLDEAAVDDVCQDVLISVAGSIGSFRGDAKVTTWVHTIVRNRVIDHLRRQRASVPLPEDDVMLGQRMSSLLATRATVQAALARLPERYREPVTLRDLDGLSYAEIAERLGRAEGTIKAQISRGRALVAADLRGDDGLGDAAWDGPGEAGRE